MVINMREALKRAQNTQCEKFDQIQSTLIGTSENTLYSLKKMTKMLELQLRVKESEIQELLRYQEEFRQEYIKVCSERDGLGIENREIVSRMSYVEKELESRRKLDFDYKEKLRLTLKIEEGPHAYEVVT